VIGLPASIQNGSVIFCNFKWLDCLTGTYWHYGRIRAFSSSVSPVAARRPPRKNFHHGRGNFRHGNGSATHGSLPELPNLGEVRFFNF
jgi:hypothetical protein